MEKSKFFELLSAKFLIDRQMTLLTFVEKIEMLHSTSIKKELYKLCVIQIHEQIDALESNLKSIQEARNNETKSSVGDKYETGRAMMQLEEDKMKMQLSQANIINNTLQRIEPDAKSNQVEQGSLVMTSQGNYYISVALGKMELEGETYFCISTDAPILQQMRGKQKGDFFILGDKNIEIKHIY